MIALALVGLVFPIVWPLAIAVAATAWFIDLLLEETS